MFLTICHVIPKAFKTVTFLDTDAMISVKKTAMLSALTTELSTDHGMDFACLSAHVTTIKFLKKTLKKYMKIAISPFNFLCSFV